MAKWLTCALLTVGLLCSGPALNTAVAQKGGGRSYSSGGGGGRSYSGGGSSSGRSYSSGGGSTSGKSYASGGSGSTSGKSYASGGSGSTFGKSYASGGNSGTQPPSSSGGVTSSGKSYSSSGNPSRPPTSSASPPGGNYPGSANPNRPAGGGATPGPANTAGGVAANTGVKPTGKSSYDAGAAQSQHMAESRANYQKGQAPQTSYVDATGSTRKIDPRDAQIRQLREDLTYERWANRDYRLRTYYGSYWSRPVVYYNDPYSSLFWWWLLDQPLQYQALWAYHHYDYMDRTRYYDLLARNAELSARVAQLERQGVPRNVNYMPPGGPDPDLAVTNEVATAVYNPVAPPAPPVVVATVPVRHPISFLHLVWVLIKFMLFFAFIAFLIWLVFIKRWGASPV